MLYLFKKGLFSQILTDWRLVVIVLVITAVAVLLLVIEEAVPYLRGEAILVEDRESSHGVNVRASYAMSYMNRMIA